MEHHWKVHFLQAASSHCLPQVQSHAYRPELAPPRHSFQQSAHQPSFRQSKAQAAERESKSTRSTDLKQSKRSRHHITIRFSSALRHTANASSPATCLRVLRPTQLRLQCCWSEEERSWPTRTAWGLTRPCYYPMHLTQCTRPDRSTRSLSLIHI